MKAKIAPTDVEHCLKDGDFIVSKTDEKGRITYCNRIFMDIAEYSEKELLDIQHNVVRHPDMPRAVFKLMWDTIQQGREFFGYVKNMTKSGDYYWVFATVAPVYDAQQKVCGYYSVRRKPRREAVDKVIPLYRQMLDAEKKAGAKDAIPAATRILTDLLEAQGQNYEQFVLSL